MAFSGQRVRALVFDNLNLKLLSFVFALALYALVHGSQDAQRSLAVSVVVLLPPESADRVLVTALPPDVRVTLRGAHGILDDLRAEDIDKIELDLRNGREQRVMIDALQVRVPEGIRVERIDPHQFELKWDDRVSQEIPVQVGVMGTPAPGFEIKGSPTADPPSVRVRGAKSEVLVIQHIPSQPFDVTGLTEGAHSRQLALDRPFGHVSVDVSSTLATVRIAQQRVEQSFTRIPVVVVGQPKARAQPPEVDVRVVGPPEIVRALRPEQILPRVEVTSNAAAGSELHAVHLDIDQCATKIAPSNVAVRW